VLYGEVKSYKKSQNYKQGNNMHELNYIKHKKEIKQEAYGLLNVILIRR